jgi:hypothetical protein
MDRASLVVPPAGHLFHRTLNESEMDEPNARRPPAAATVDLER